MTEGVFGLLTDAFSSLKLGRWRDKRGHGREWIEILFTGRSENCAECRLNVNTAVGRRTVSRYILIGSRTEGSW